MSGVWRIGTRFWGGHLGPAVSALVDGQLDEESSERAWDHVLHCPSCRRQVEREGWVKRQLAQMSGSGLGEPSRQLIGSLHQLDPVEEETREAWAAVDELEERGRGRRRAGIAAVGVGSVSAAVLGISALSSTALLGGTPPAPPATSLTRTTPTAGPLAQLRAPAADAAVTGPSSFVPFSGWSFSTPAKATVSAATFRTQR
jgi:hypothetical protein